MVGEEIEEVEEEEDVGTATAIGQTTQQEFNVAELMKNSPLLKLALRGRNVDADGCCFSLVVRRSANQTNSSNANSPRGLL